MQQRVAIARALIAQPEVLLMDEPFSALDALTRESLRDLLLRLWEELHLTVIFVTHDISEAIYLSDRIFVLGKASSTILAEEDVQLPRPRDQLSTRESSEFLMLRRSLYQMVLGKAGHCIKMFSSRASGFLLLVALLVLWEMSVRLGWVVSPTWPPISEVLLTFGRLCVDGTYFHVLGQSLVRLAEGYAIATVSAVAAGIVMGTWRRAYLLFEPLLELLRPILSPAYLPMAILFLGIDDTMKVFMVAFSSFFPILLNTIAGVRSVDDVLIDTGRTFGLHRASIIRRIVLPAAGAYVLTGMRISLAIALIVTVIAEMVAGNSGIGFYILSAQRSFLIPEMYAGVIALALTGFALNKGFVAVEHALMHWHDASRGT
jgi:ABC-type nitrate/sulfonate/bicarbonate transport system permease component